MSAVNRWAPPPKSRAASKQVELPCELGPVAVAPENPQHWQTPERLLSVVRAIGPIGLDVCTSAANPTGARRFYTAMGLDRRWQAGEGEVIFCNPPFEEAAPWCGKARAYVAERMARAERRRGSWVPPVVMVLPLRTHRRWWWEVFRPGPDLWVELFAVCEPVTFRGAPSAAPWPVAIAVFGPDVRRYTGAFFSAGVPAVRLEHLEGGWFGG